MRFDVRARALLKYGVAKIDPGFFKGIAQRVDQPNAVGVVVDTEPFVDRNASARPDLFGNCAGNIQQKVLEIALHPGQSRDFARAHATARAVSAASAAIPRA
ncbi:MAG: hypothetical protein Q8K35_03430 [Thiobacillus sp.]|nr:hypothetical protein [Thiobacillus sp.]MDP2056797.1 hypothetical protein [Thiobacillus sp.]